MKGRIAQFRLRLCSLNEISCYSILQIVELGRYSFIAAGAVVSKDVPDYALMMGIPAKHIGWMSRHGIRLPEADSDGIMICPESGYRYKEIEPGVVRCLDLDEDSPLPPDKALGRASYDQFKKK